MDNRLQLAEFMKQIESKLSVNKWKINDLKIWPIIRNEIIFNTTVKNVKGFNCLKEHISSDSIVREFDFDNVSKSDIIILSHTNYSQFIDNIVYDRFFSVIIDELQNNGMDVLFLNRVATDIKGNPYHRFYDIEPYIKSIIASNKFWEISKINLKGYDDLVSILKEFGKRKNIDINIVREEEIIKLYNYIKNLSSFFEYIIKKSKAKVFMYPCYYGVLGYSINLACNNLGVNSIEMQHGTIDKHVMYNGFNRETGIKYSMFPKYFWGWNKNIIPESLNYNYEERQDRFLHGGNQWYYFWNKKLTKKEVSIKLNENTTNILFTQQAGMKGFLLEAIEKSPENYKWFIRFHPRLIKAERENFIKKIKLLNKKVDFQIANDTNLFDLLNYMDVHITEYSSSFHEAALMQVPSIIINTLGEEMYKEQEGYYKSAYNSEDLLKCIGNLEKNQIQKIYKHEDIEEVFNNGIKKIITLINETHGESSEISYINHIENVFEHKSEKNNKEFEEKIRRLQYIEDTNRLYFIGKYSYLIREYEKAAKNLKEYIITEQADLINVGYVLDSILLYNQIDEKYIKESFETYELLEKIVENNKYFIETIFHSLFINKKYDYILELSKLCNKNKLTYVYLARTYKEFKDYKNAINYFLKFIKFLEQEDINYKSILSVYFHLAETYYYFGDYKNAKKYFLKCEELTGGHHIRAKEYLKIIK